MTVAELREICRDRGLLVSGKKAAIIDRILGEPGEEEESEPEVPEALIMEDDPPAEEEKSSSQRVEEALSRTKDQVIEAEVVVAEVVVSEPVVDEATEDDQASLVITIPSIS